MRKNSLTRQARRAYDQSELARICQLREDRFGRAFGMQTIRTEPKRKSYRSDRSDYLPEDYYHFRDNNSSVLAVAHLDTVVGQKGRAPHFRSTERGPLITSGALDDRLGAYVILALLPKLGVTCDWLLTVGEESGASTAEHFDPGGKKYDWAIEFDRGGTDVVMYQYDDRPSQRLVEAAGAEMGWGSYSDIAYLDQLGVKAFNWGVGYRGNYHSEAGYAYLNDTFAMVAKYLRFHEQNAGTRMPHDPDPGRYGSRYDTYDEADHYSRCDSCGEEAVDSVTWYCTFCGICQDCGATDPDVAADWNDPDVEVCQCYTPSQREAARPEQHNWTGKTWDEYLGRNSSQAGMTWSEYLAQRPAGPDDDTLKDAHAAAQAKDGPGPLISAAPPWSEHRPVSHGLGVPTSQSMLDKRPWNREIGPWAAADETARSQWTSAVSLPASAAGYADRLREEKDKLTARFGEARSAVNPPAVFPDAPSRDLLAEDRARKGWHESARGSDGLYIAAHTPGQAWAQICLRCAARWPHPASGRREIHPGADCPGCERCIAANAGPGTIHVIPAHLAGDSAICGLCIQYNAALTEIDRGDASAQRETMRALDASEGSS